MIFPAAVCASWSCLECQLSCWPCTGCACGAWPSSRTLLAPACCFGVHEHVQPSAHVASLQAGGPPSNSGSPAQLPCACMASTHLCCAWNMTGVGSWLCSCRLQGSRNMCRMHSLGAQLCESPESEVRCSVDCSGVCSDHRSVTCSMCYSYCRRGLVTAGVCLSWSSVSKPG
jgi:hypothetical protein